MRPETTETPVTGTRKGNLILVSILKILNIKGIKKNLSF